MWFDLVICKLTSFYNFLHSLCGHLQCVTDWCPERFCRKLLVTDCKELFSRNWLFNLNWPSLLVADMIAPKISQQLNLSQKNVQIQNFWHRISLHMLYTWVEGGGHEHLTHLHCLYVVCLLFTQGGYPPKML